MLFRSPSRAIALLGFVLLVCGLHPARTDAKAARVTCKTCPISGIQPDASKALGAVTKTEGCSVRMKNDLPIPDPRCTPGAINPTVTLAVLKDPTFRTGCVRNCATSDDKKNETYEEYGIARALKNKGKAQVCELDHLVSLELGGADSLDNIWPQCGPNKVVLSKRYFKRKDAVENYLAAQVRAGKMSLKLAQTEIASDWTQFFTDAQGFCAQSPKSCKAGD